MNEEIEFTGHPKGAWLLLTTVMWEFFSYYGMRALLVLFLSQKLLLSDSYAFNIYGAYTSMVYVTPIVGGYFADKFLGYRWATILGAVLIAIGHFTLASGFDKTLFIGLALIVTGVGFFKTNSIALLGEFYPDDKIHRQSAFNLYYAAGNLGGFVSSLLCAWIAQLYGWHWGFILAGIGMSCGLIIITIGRKHFRGKGEHRILEHQYIRVWTLLIIGLFILIAIVTTVLFELLAGYVLLIVGIASILYVVKIHLTCDKHTRGELSLYYCLTFASTIFWAFDQQGGSSINLFIARNIDRHFGDITLPAAMFQAINPLVIILFVPIVSLIWRTLAKRGVHPSLILRTACGFLLCTFGFTIITYTAHLATITGQASLWLILIGMGFVGIAEVFIDPIALAFVTRIAPDRSVSVLTGLYYLFCGAIANYLAAQIAKLTTLNLARDAQLTVYAAGYESVYGKIALIGLIMVIILVLFRLIFRKLSVK